MVLEMIRWWYTAGWLGAMRRIGVLTQQTLRTFSVPTLLGTLFSPWRRIVSLPGRSLDDKIRAAFDNFISRCVGFFVRLLVLLAAAVMVSLTFLTAGIIAALWPLLPLGMVYAFYRSITG